MIGPASQVVHIMVSSSPHTFQAEGLSSVSPLGMDPGCDRYAFVFHLFTSWHFVSRTGRWALLFLASVAAGPETAVCVHTAAGKVRAGSVSRAQV